MDLIEHQDTQGARHPWETARIRIVQRLIETLPDPPSTLRVLDVGAGDGFAINELTQTLNFAEGVAQDAHYSDEWLHKLQGGRVRFVRQLADVAEARYDLALFLDVIEHVEDDAALLRSGTALLRPQGWALITVPAFNSLFSQHDRQLKHFRRYSRQELVAAISKADLRCIDSGYFFCSLLAPRVLRLWGERVLGNGAAKNLGQWKGGAFNTSLITGALSLDDWICRAARAAGITLPGLSCWALCQKP